MITYDPQKDDKETIRARFTKALRLALDSANKKISIDAGRLASSQLFEVDFWFYLPVSSSDSVTKKNSKFWGFEQPNSKPDYDNLEKFYLDCANGVFWPDDSMIIDAHAHKRYSENPRVEITIKTRQGMKMHEKAEKVVKVFSPNELKEFLRDVSLLAMFDPEQIDKMEEEELSTWLTNAACEISRFAAQHVGTLKKVASKSGGDITQEVLSFIDKKHQLQEVI